VASSAPNSAPQKWRRPVKQRSRLVRRTGPPHSRVEFAHHSEQEFARFLDYYRIRWVYEPMSFPIAWEGTRVSEMFTPDFYLPEQDMYVELTTMKQSLVTPKNRKLRMLKELYPELNVRLLYRKDYQQLLAKAGYGVLEVQNLRRQDIGEILISPVELETRVRALGRKISRDYRGESLVVVGMLKGITFFLADLARQITVPFVIDYLDLRRYAGAQPKDRVRIARDLDYPIEGRHVLLVEDIINTGFTLDTCYPSSATGSPRRWRWSRCSTARCAGWSRCRSSTWDSRFPTTMSSATGSTTASCIETCLSSARCGPASTTSPRLSHSQRRRPKTESRSRCTAVPPAGVDAPSGVL
jgi:hypothetical protein